MKEIEMLEKQYQSFINQERDWNFFLGLADYTKFTEETPLIYEALKKLEREKEREFAILDNTEEEAIKELLSVKNKITRIIKKKKTNNEKIKSAFIEFTKYEKGEIYPERYKSHRLDEGLKILIKVLCENGFKDWIKENLSIEIKNEDIVRLARYNIISDKYIKRCGIGWELREKKDTELWGAYDKLKLLLKVVYHGKKHLYSLEEKNKDNAEFRKLLDEIEIIKKDGADYGFASFYYSERKKEKFSSSNNSGIKEFKKDNYNLHATRIHNYLIKELSEIKNEELEILKVPNDLENKKMGGSKKTPEKSFIQEEIEKRVEKYKEKENLKKEIIQELGGRKQNNKNREKKQLITRDKNTGDFYYKNKLINLLDKKTIYYLIFECLYEKADFNGFCSYEIINRYLEENDKKRYTDERQIRDRIKNGIADLFRFSKLPQKTPTGKKIIDFVRGKGLTFNNPTL